MVMPGRSHAVGGAAYRYGMNGQEKENEVFEGASSAEFWEYDARLGRRWENDPLSKEWQSAYATFDNNPIYYSDPNGLEAEDGGDEKNKGGDDNKDNSGDKNKDKNKDDAKQKGLEELNKNCKDCYFINEKGEYQLNSDPNKNNGNTTGSNPNDQQGTRQEGGTSTNNGGGNSGETSSGSPTKKGSVDGYYLGSARSAWTRGNYSDWFGYRLKHFLGEDFDKRSEKYTRPYAEFIADLNPLLNASNIINGAVSGNSIYGNKMTKTDYVFSAIGIVGLGEIKGGYVALKSVTTNYWRVFYTANPYLKKFIGTGLYQIHHRIPQAYIKSGLFPKEMLSSLSNLQYIPTSIHQKIVTPMWNSFMKRYPNATRAQIVKFAIDMDKIIAPYIK